MFLVNAIFNHAVDITVSYPPLRFVSVRLSLNDNLSNVRKVLKDHILIEMNDTLLFAKKNSQTNNDNDTAIARESEENYYLKEIIKVVDDDDLSYYLYLTKNPSPSWIVLNDNCKLDYGRTMSIDGNKIADKKAFIMKGCELTKIGAEGYKKDIIEFESKEDWMGKTNLFFSTDINVQNFVKSGISIGRLNENFNDEIDLTYEYIELGKVSLNLSKKNLEPTQEFIKVVKDAVESEDPIEEFKKITEDYGQFIPTEVILGGRAYFKSDKISSRNSSDKCIEGSTNASISDPTTSNSKFYSFNNMKILGGKHPDDENFNEKTWIESLKDYQVWDCIEFRNPVNIFKLLPYDKV